MRRVVIAVGIAAATASCTSDTSLQRARRPVVEEQIVSPPGSKGGGARSPGATTGATSPRPSRSRQQPPAPNSAIPSAPAGFAHALVDAHTALDRHTRRWVDAGAQLATPDTKVVELWALYQQRLYRRLARSVSLTEAVLRRVPRPLRATVTANATAQRRLASGLTPVRPPVRLKTYDPAAPRDLRRWHESAGARFGIPWHVLAAINLVESRFGRILGPSAAGALGPMQFLPSTWERYGAGGDIMDPRDAIFGAARYLTASGAQSDIRQALYTYNRSDDYVAAVLLFAREMRRDPQSFYSYYFWQVFVRTTRGDVQLTGPGADR